MKEKILFDANEIDQLYVDEKFFIKLSHYYSFHICPSIIEEIIKIPDEEKRVKYILLLFKYGFTYCPDGCFILGKTRLGYCILDDGKTYNNIIKSTRSNMSDSIIANTAVRNNMILFTEDTELKKKLLTQYKNVVNLCDLKQLLEEKNTKDENKWLKNFFLDK